MRTMDGMSAGRAVGLASRGLALRYRSTAVAAFALLVLASPGRAWGACSTNICTVVGDECRITAPNTVDNLCTLDFAADRPNKRIVVTRPGKLQTAANGYSFTIKAHQLVVQGTLQAQGGTLTIETSNGTPGGPTNGAVRTEVVSNSPGKIDVRNGGTLRITAVGKVELFGQDVNADGPAGGRGGAVVVSGTEISATTPIHADGKTGGDGGFIELVSPGNVSVDGLTTANGEGVNGTIAAEGGGIRFRAGGTLTVTKSLLVKGDEDGSGGFIDLFSTGFATLSGNYNTNGVGITDGADGGRITADVGGGTISGAWTAVATASGEAGIVEIRSTGALTMTATSSADVSSGAQAGGIAGSVTIEGDGAVTLGGAISANAGGPGSEAGDITITAATSVTVTSTLEARTTTNNGDMDGTIRLRGCSVTVSGNLKTRNQRGRGLNAIEYTQTFTGNGATFVANDSGGNTIRCGCTDTSPADGTCDGGTPSCTHAPSLVGATTTPSPVVVPTVYPSCG